MQVGCRLLPEQLHQIIHHFGFVALRPIWDVIWRNHAGVLAALADRKPPWPLNCPYRWDAAHADGSDLVREIFFEHDLKWIAEPEVVGTALVEIEKTSVWASPFAFVAEHFEDDPLKRAFYVVLMMAATFHQGRYDVVHEAAAPASHVFHGASSHVLERLPQVGSFGALNQAFKALMKRLLVGIQHAWINQAAFFGQ
jgi:hypothetical protein